MINGVKNELGGFGENAKNMRGLFFRESIFFLLWKNRGQSLVVMSLMYQWSTSSFPKHYNDYKPTVSKNQGTCWIHIIAVIVLMECWTTLER